MKTDARPLSPANAATDSTPPAEHPLASLLHRATNKLPPERADGIAIGQLERIDDGGVARVSIDLFGLTDIPAQALVPLTPECLGQPVALGFESSDPHRPIILGLLLTTDKPAVAQASRQTPQDNARVVLAAESELELRCGEAVILLEADGRITIRGTSVTSHATASQRIRGGSVQIN